MTRSEFKAWFDGFSENIHGVPSKKQWERIIERVNEINEDEVIRERIIERRRDWWPLYWMTSVYTGTPSWIVDNNSTTTATFTCNAIQVANDIGAWEAKQLS